MIEKLQFLFKKKIVIFTILAVIILLQVFNFCYNMAYNKTEYNQDELYSYGLANSYQNPFLNIKGYINSDYPDFFNVEEWTDSGAMGNYLTVDSEHIFDYANVWYNQSLDRHPPFYYAVLHTVCSFFPEQFSPWFGYGVNLACFIVMQIFLFLLAKKLFKSNLLSFLTVICYGFSVGALSTFIFIRMYAMLTMWVVILAFLHAKLLSSKEQLKIKNLIPVTIIVTLGALTQHQFTIIAFVFAVCFCLYYLFKKQFKNLLKYGCSMLLGVILAWAIFPPLMSQIFSEGNNPVITLIFQQQFITALYYPISSLFGFNAPNSGTLVFLAIAIPPLLLIIIIFMIPICFLFRNSKRFISLKNKIVLRIKSFQPKQLFHFFSRMKFFPLYIAMLISSLILTVILAHTLNFFLTGHCDRYLFTIYPLVLLLSIALIRSIIHKLKFNRYIICILFTLLLINNISNTQSQYLLNNKNTIKDLAQITANADCIIAETQYIRMVSFTANLRNTNHVFYTIYPFDRLENLYEFTPSNPFYFIISNTICDSSIDTGIAFIEQYFSDFYANAAIEYLGTTTVSEGDYFVYCIG